MSVAMCLLGLANDASCRGRRATVCRQCRGIKIHLMDGSQITGRLAQQEIEIDTQFGKLNIPVAAIVSLTPGLGSHPMVGQNLDALIAKLGSPVFRAGKRRRRATTMGPTIRLKLVAAAEDPDTERRTREDHPGRVRSVRRRCRRRRTSKPATPDRSRHDRDDRIRHRGKNRPARICHRQPIRRFERQAQRHPAHPTRDDREARFAKDHRRRRQQHDHATTKDTGIRVERGDKVTFTADGTITMTPWGNQAVSTPDGHRTTAGTCPTKSPAGRWWAKSARAARCSALAPSTVSRPIERA